MAVVTHGWQSEPIDGPKGGAGLSSFFSFFVFHCPASKLPTYTYPFIDPAFYLSIYRPIQLTILLSFHLPMYLPLTIYLAIHLFVNLSAYLFSYPSIYLPIHHYPPIYISIHHPSTYPSPSVFRIACARYQHSH